MALCFFQQALGKEIGVAPMQDDLIFIFNVGVGLVPTLSAFRGQPQGIAPTISSQSHATPRN